MKWFKKGPNEERISKLEKEIKSLKKILRHRKESDDLLRRNIESISKATQYIDEVMGVLSDEQREKLCQTKLNKY